MNKEHSVSDFELGDPFGHLPSRDMEVYTSMSTHAAQERHERVSQERLNAQPQTDFKIPSSWLKEWKYTFGPYLCKCQLTDQREYLRPSTTFANTNNFEIPRTNLSERIIKDNEYFQFNYSLIFLGFFVYCAFITPLLMIPLAISLAVGYILFIRHQRTPLTLCGREVPLAKEYGIVLLLSIPLFLLNGTGVFDFLIVGASFIVITLHASFFNIEAILQPEQSEQSVGLLDQI